MKFLYGKEGYLINQRLRVLINEYGGEPIIYSDNEPLNDILLDASTASMFEEKKMLIIKNHNSFKNNDGVQEFIDQIKNNTDTLFIFVYEAEKLERKNQLVDFLLTNADAEEFKGVNSKNITKIIKEMIADKEATIDNNALVMLSNMLPEDLRIIVSEVEKLIMQKKHIDIEMVKTSITEYIKEDYFELVNAIIAGDVHGIVIAYRNRRRTGVETTTIISQISSIMSLALKVKALKAHGMSNQEISDKLKIHVFRISKANELISSTSNIGIGELIKSLSQLDKDIKTGMVDPYHGIETYLLKIIK